MQKVFEIITLETVTSFLSDNSLQFEPSQQKVSFPVLERIHRRLFNGKVFSPIKVTEGKIIDGHHRFICLSLLGMEVVTVIASENATHKSQFSWTEMTIDAIDYDKPEEIEAYAQQYDF